MKTNYWLKICKEAGNKVFSEIKKYLKKKERKKVIRMGFGGDKTLLIDDITEKIILDCFRMTRKSFRFISEESGNGMVGENPEVLVVIDPIDGSKNLKFGIPFASTSIAIGDIEESMGGIEIGYVKNLINGDEYYAVKGNGAFKNGGKIRVSEEENSCLLVDVCTDKVKNLKRMVNLEKEFERVRVLGSCSLEMCFLAEGIVGGYVALGSRRTIDQAASQLIVKEAGGIVKDLEGNDFSSYDIGFKKNLNLIAAQNEAVYKKIKRLLIG